MSEVFPGEQFEKVRAVGEKKILKQVDNRKGKNGLKRTETKKKIGVG